MEYPRVRPRTEPPATPGVYVDVDHLVRMQFQAKGISFLPAQPVSSLLMGRHRSRIRGRGLDFEEIRGYLPGDDVRSIDWRVTARTGEPHIRVFTEERDRPALLVVDQRLGMFYGTVKNLKSVTAAETSALAAWRVYDAGDRVGALVFNDHETQEIRPHRSRDSLLRTLSTVARMNRELQASDTAALHPERLNEALRRAERLARHDYLVLVISDFDGADDETRGMLLRMNARNDVVCAVVHDPSATDLPPAESLVVSDGELQMELGLGGERTRQHVAQFASGRIARLLEWQRSTGVPMLPLSSGEDTAEQIRRLLGGTTGGRR
jgi:uncharacterized protein (DUF58 family)